jgi:diadenosine tetraphosphate (Ap4A) HIT family hydrolase
MFSLHPQLAKDCHVVGDLELCKVLLMNDSQYPWLILVPQKADLTEIFQLSEADQWSLLKEQNAVSKVINRLFQTDKLNIAALGNMVSQLHIHCIGRFKSDAAWPKPVWGVQPPIAYCADDLTARLELLRAALIECGLR